jgi:hypothetical protein
MVDLYLLDLNALSTCNFKLSFGTFTCITAVHTYINSTIYT